MTKTMNSLAILWIASALLVAGPAMASNAIAKTEDQVCTSCHDKPGSKLLTDEGKYYEFMRTLDGYDEIEAAFGKCVTCHSRKPGSEKLTKTGKRYQWMMNDMDGLRDFVMQRHPDVEQLEVGEDELKEMEEKMKKEGSSPDR